MRKGNTVANHGGRNAIRVLGAGSATGLAGLLFPRWLRAADGITNPSAFEGTPKKENAVGVHPNWYFFSDANGDPVVFTGSHTWGRRRENKIRVSDGWDLSKFNKYLDFLQHWNHNYIRLWTWEQEGDVSMWEKGPGGKPVADAALCSSTSWPYDSRRGVSGIPARCQRRDCAGSPGLEL